MTRVQWVKMTKEQKLKRVAKHAKWKQEFLGYAPDDGHLGPCAERYSRCPNYLTNLNAIDKVVREAIDKKGVSFLIKFYRVLMTVLGHHDHLVHADIIMADAEQRAEAYVMAMEGP